MSELQDAPVAAPWPVAPAESAEGALELPPPPLLPLPPPVESVAGDEQQQQQQLPGTAGGGGGSRPRRAAGMLKVEADFLYEEGEESEEDAGARDEDSGDEGRRGGRRRGRAAPAAAGRRRSSGAAARAPPGGGSPVETLASSRSKRQRHSRAADPDMLDTEAAIDAALDGMVSSRTSRSQAQAKAQAQARTRSRAPAVPAQQAAAAAAVHEEALAAAGTPADLALPFLPGLAGLAAPLPSGVLAAAPGMFAADMAAAPLPHLPTSTSAAGGDGDAAAVQAAAAAAPAAEGEQQQPACDGQGLNGSILAAQPGESGAAVAAAGMQAANVESLFLPSALAAAAFQAADAAAAMQATAEVPMAQSLAAAAAAAPVDAGALAAFAAAHAPTAAAAAAAAAAARMPAAGGLEQAAGPVLTAAKVAEMVAAAQPTLPTPLGSPAAPQPGSLPAIIPAAVKDEQPGALQLPQPAAPAEAAAGPAAAAMRRSGASGAANGGSGGANGTARVPMDVLYGCAKCRYLRGGCNTCRAREPAFSRPRMRWQPAKGHYQTGIEAAPVFRPTPEQFRDPIAYISSIRPQAEKYGLAHIVPPPGWDPPFALERGTNGLSMESFRFAVRKQYTSHLCCRAAPAPPAPGTPPLEPAKAAAAASGSGASGGGAGAPDGRYSGRMAGSLRGSGAGGGAGGQPESLPEQQEHQEGAVGPPEAAGRGRSPAHAGAGAQEGPEDADGPPAEFGFPHLEKRHTLRSFSAYADWAKEIHFSDPLPAQSSSRVAGGGSRSARTSQRRPRCLPNYSTLPEPSVEQIEAEFWRIVEAPEERVESLYGQDVDSGHHGSGFPLPLWRRRLLEQHLARQALLGGGAAAAGVELPGYADDAERHYAEHPWNINNLPRCHSSVLRYLPGASGELITGVMVPWLYVGSCLSAFCWHVEDHALCSINYHHMGAPKVWYGVPASATAALEEAARDALPHLFETNPRLLYQLVTALSPAELKRRGIPVYRVVHEPGSFVVTMPDAYHSGFNCGFNVAEAVNFAPSDWLPYGTDVTDKYRASGKPLTLSHDSLLVALVQAAEHKFPPPQPPAAAAEGRAASENAGAPPAEQQQPAEQPAEALQPADAPGGAAEPACGRDGAAAHSALPQQADELAAAAPQEQQQQQQGPQEQQQGEQQGEQEQQQAGGPQAGTHGGQPAPGAADTQVPAAQEPGPQWGHEQPPAGAQDGPHRRPRRAEDGPASPLGPAPLHLAPTAGIALAAGELVLRSAEERRRRTVSFVAVGALSERRMATGAPPGSKDSRGVHTNTADCDCAHCSCDLWLSAVVSPAAPGLAVCPEHVSVLVQRYGCPRDTLVLLYRHSPQELDALVAAAVERVPGAAEAVAAARQRRARIETCRVRAVPVGPLYPMLRPGQPAGALPFPKDGEDCCSDSEEEEEERAGAGSSDDGEWEGEQRRRRPSGRSGAKRRRSTGKRQRAQGGGAGAAGVEAGRMGGCGKRARMGPSAIWQPAAAAARGSGPHAP